MKKILFFLRRHAIQLTGLVLMILLFGACKKTLDTGTQPPVAGLMALNLVPDKASVNITLSGRSLTNSPLLYTNYTGGYLGVYTGNRDVTSYDFNSGTMLASTSQLFADSSNYSLFVLGANGSYRNLIVKDNLDSLQSTSGEAFVRYVNAIADSTQQPLVTVSSGATNIFSNNAPFATVSGFKGITPGDVSVKVSNESAINSSRTITLEQGKIYTILLVGIPGQADSAKAVQIRFIQNGVVPTTP
jgi:Domain of unknown function (DUF4397)